MNKTEVFKRAYATLLELDALDKKVEDAMKSIFHDFGGLFDSSSVRDSIVVTMSRIYCNTNEEDELTYYKEWIEWWLYEKPSCPVVVSDGFSYDVESIDDFCDFLDDTLYVG